MIIHHFRLSPSRDYILVLHGEGTSIYWQKNPCFFCFLTVFFFSNLPSPPVARISSACRNITKKINDRQHASYVLQVCITFSIPIVFRCGNVDAEKVLYCLKTNWWLTYDLSLIISRDREVSYKCKDPWIKIWDANEYGSDPRNYEHYLSSYESKAWKKKKARDLNPWPLRYRRSALSTKLTSQLGAGYYVGSK